jgi:hypothetical protein
MSDATEKPFFDSPASAPDTGDYPGIDAIGLREHTRIELGPDGRTRRTERIAYKVFTEFGRDRLSDTHVVFHEKNQKLHLGNVTTFMADGRRVEAPEITRLVMTPFALDRAPAFADFQQWVITNVGTERGAVKVIEYEVEDLEPWRELFFGRVLLGGEYPILEKVLEIAVPKGRTLRWDLPNGAPEPERSEGDGFEVFTWRLSELPPYPAEDRPASAAFLVPTVVYSALPSVGELTRRLRGRAEGKTEADEALATWARKAVEGIESPEQKILKMHAETVDAVRKIEWPLAGNDFHGRPAPEVFGSRYGSAWEMGFVLTAALGALEIPARLRLARDRHLGAGELAWLGPDTECWVEAGPEGRSLWLNAASPAGTSGPYHTAERTFLRLEDDAPAFIDPPARETRATAKAELTVAADRTLRAKARLGLRGRFNPFLTLQSSDDAEAAKKQAEALVPRLLGGAELSTFDYRVMDLDFADLRLEFKAPALAEAVRDIFFLELPVAAFGLLGIDPSLHRARRTTVFDLGGPFAYRADTEITFPGELEVKAVPANLDGAAGPFRLVRTWTRDGKKLTCSETVEAAGKFLPPEHYPALRELLLGVLNPVRNRVVLAAE